MNYELSSISRYTYLEVAKICMIVILYGMDTAEIFNVYTNTVMGRKF